MKLPVKIYIHKAKDTNIFGDDFTLNKSPVPLQPLNDTVIKRFYF